MTRSLAGLVDVATGATSRPATRTRILAGWTALVASLALVLVTGPSLANILLAAVATLGLAGDARLGWLGAGALVAFALPFGGPAEIHPYSVAGVPLRPQDVAIGLAVVGLLPSLRWPAPARARIMLVAVAVFLAAGVMAIIIGVALHNQLRDVLRDVRWWAIYAVPALAILARVRRAQVLRGLLLGVSIFAGLVLLTAVAPRFDGGLKAAVLTYMLGTLRMQMVNSVFLTPAALFVGWLAVRQPSVWRIGWLCLLISAQIMSLTRTSIIVLAVFGTVMVVGQLPRVATLHPSRRWFRRGALVLATAVTAFAVGVVLVIYGTPAPASSTGATKPQNPISRITFTDTRTDVSVIAQSAVTGGRLATYLNAYGEIRQAPLIGSGMGKLVDVAFAYSPLRAHTRYKQPGVDNAYLTIGLKAGSIGMIAFGGMMLLALWRGVRLRSIRGWYVPAWLGLLIVMLTQSFAVSGYGPFGVSLLLVLPFLGRSDRPALGAPTS